MSDSTTFDIDVNVTGDQQVATAAEKLALYSQRLADAGTASTEASAAVKAAEQAYRQSDVAADRAAKSVEKLAVQQEVLRGKMEAAMKAGNDQAFWKTAAASEALAAKQAEAAAKSDAAKASLADQAAKLDGLRASAAAAAEAEKQLTAEHTKLKAAQEAESKAATAAQKAQDDAAKKAQSAAEKEAAAAAKSQKAHDDAAQAAAQGSGKFSELAEATGKIGGPLGTMGQKVFGAAEGFKKLGAAAGTSVGAIAAVALVAALVIGAIVGATYATLKWSLALSEAARTNQLLNEGIAQSVKGGADLTASIANLSKSVPQSRDELQKMASDLAKTGLQGKDLEKALKTSAEAAAKAKWGPAWEKQLLGVDKQTEIFKANLSDLFGHLKIEGLLKGLQKIIALFDASSVTGKAIKIVFEDVFQRLVDQLEKLGPLIVSAFIQMEIWALRALIAIKPHKSEIVAVAKGLGILAAVLGGIVVAAFVVVVAVAATFLTIVGLVWLGIRSTASALYDAGAAAYAFAAGIVGGATSAVEGLIARVTGAIDWLRSLSLSELGMQIIQGLATGLLGGGPAIVDAISGVVSGAIDTAKKLLGIASPSKVFAQIGAHTAAGMEEGVDAGTGDVHSSIERMVGAPATDAATPSLAKDSSSSSGGAVDLSGATFNFYGVEGAEDAEGRFRALLTRILEGDALQLGAEAEAAT